MTDREAMKLALAKLEHLWDIGIDAAYKVELLPEIEVLRQALAQPEQAEYDKLTVKFGERAKEYLEAAKKSWEPEQEPVACVKKLNTMIIGCDDVINEDGVHKDAKSLAKLVKKDCYEILQNLEEEKNGGSI